MNPYRRPAPSPISDPNIDGSAHAMTRGLNSPGLRLLGLYAIVRSGLVLADVFAAHVSYSSKLSGPLHSWDSNWYLVVASHWYPRVAPTLGGRLTYSAAGFLPVFPGLIRLVSLMGLSVLAAALVVSLVAGAVTVMVVWRLGAALLGEPGGWNAAVLFMLFPGMGVSWGLLYCECVGLGLVAASLLLMLRERWVWAGVVGAIASATSPLALPLALGAAVPVVQALRRHEMPRALATVLLAPCGFAGYAIFLSIRYRDAVFWWHLQTQAWGASVDFGRSLSKLLAHMWAIGYQGPSWLEWVGLIAVVAAAVALWRARLPGVVNAYCLGVGVLLLVSNSLGFKPRLLTWAFPALIAVAAIVRPRTWLAIAVGFACLIPLVFLAYTILGNTMAQP